MRGYTGRMTEPLYPVWPEHEAELASLQGRLRYQGGDFIRWQGEARHALAELVGLKPVGAIQQADLLWRQGHALGVIEKWMLHVPAWGPVLIYACWPTEPRRDPMPAMVCLQGHSTGMHVSIGMETDERTMVEQTPGDRDLALQCLRHGVAAVCVEQRGFGQRRDAEDQRTDCQFMTLRAFMLGRTLVAERVMDVQIALGWLQQSGRVDVNRMGVMGNSAGGTTAFFASALLDDIHLAVPSCSFGRLRDTWFATRRCACGYVPGLARLMDLPDVLALHAPKPVVVVAGREDALCPGPAAKAAFDDLQSRYASIHAADACTLCMGEQGHRFYAALAWPAMLKWL